MADTTTPADSLERRFVEACNRRGLDAAAIPDAAAAALPYLHERIAEVADVLSGHPGSHAYLAAALEAWRSEVDAEAGTAHRCQPPPVSERMSAGAFADRRWDCPEDGTRFILVRRMVGRQMYGEWRKMPEGAR